MSYSFLRSSMSALIIILLLCSASLSAQPESILGQRDRLGQYAGHWVSAINPETDSLSAIPQIKMTCISYEDGQSLVVEVLEYNGEEYQPLLLELISYDAPSDLIRAFGQNVAGEMFLGKGQFTSANDWTMQDEDLKGNQTIRVQFHFLSFTDVIVEGIDSQNKSLWKTRYIKKNPKDKSIGVQLVSVHQEMQRAPAQTLLELSRMGYSYIETFVYSEGKFYGMSPTQFRDLVEQSGMRFKGSMTFYDLPGQGGWDDAMAWWKKCIEDHKLAGVDYLSTSNNQIKNIKSKAELQAYCEYYNAIGALCRANGLQFVFHNHADEFLTIDGVRVYDYFLENTNPEYVFFQADIYWMHVGGVDPIEWFKNYPGRIISWHVKDYQELGKSGRIDFEELIKYSQTSGLQYLVAEVEDYNFPPLHSIGLAWEYIYYHLLNE